MIDIFIRTIKSITSKELIKTSIICLFITAVVLISFVFGIKAAMSHTHLVSTNWLEKMLDYLADTGAVITAWFLFPLLTPVIASFFADSVAEKIEKKDYPNTITKINNNFIAILIEAVKFAIKTLFLNIICLPLYLIPLVNVFVYYNLNAYLLGREFFDMAATRYVEQPYATKLRKSNKLTVLLAGLLIVFTTNIPFVNLFAPIIGITLMVHLFFYLNKNPQSQNLS